MSAQRLKQSVSVCMDRIRGLQPNRADICMSALRLGRAKKEVRNSTGLNTSHYKATNQEPTGLEGVHAKCKETEARDGEVDPPPQRPIRCSLQKGDTLTPERVSYREPA